MNKDIRTIIIFSTIAVALLGSFLFILPLFFGTKETDDRMTVATSIYPLYFVASEIAGPDARVINLTPPGAEPHDYELTPGDISTVTQSELLIINGAGLEHWGKDLNELLKGTPAEVLSIADSLPTRTMDHDGEKVLDPHFWLSPLLMKEMARSVTDAFVRVDPEHAEAYRARGIALDNELSVLHEEYRSTLSSCAKKELVSSHNAFGYLGVEYGLATLPIAGISPEAEPSPRQMAEIATLVRERGVNAIFFEALVSPRLAETLAEETGVRTLMLDPLEGLNEDKVEVGANYLSVMRENLANLKDALECAQ